MRIKATPEDFVVEEQIRLRLVERGPCAVYRVHKRNVTTLEVQDRLAAHLKVRKELIAFPALKDKDALATQYVSVELPAWRSPETAFELQHPNASVRIEFAGFAERALQPSDLRGNLFSIVVRDLALDEAQRMTPRLKQMGEYGVLNYFDEQRFGSFAGESGFLAKHILQRDAESAVRIYLSEKMVGDPERVRVFKEFAHAHWGEWEALMEHAPKPSNFRSVLTYLKDHPSDFRRALNLIPHRLLTLYLSAYQSWLWNLIAGQYVAFIVAAHEFGVRTVRIAGTELPVYLNLPESLRPIFERLQIPLPNHRAAFANAELERVALEVLAHEGLTLNDFKARILKKAFAAKSSRALVIHPQQINVSSPENDELARRRWKLTLKFFLPPGSYATLLIKSIALR